MIPRTESTIDGACNLPKDLTTEDRLLGALVVFPNAMAAARETGLRAEHFFLQSNQVLFRELAAIFLEHPGAGQDLIFTWLTTHNTLDAVGGWDRLIDMAKNAVGDGDVKFHSERLIELYKHRAIHIARYAAEEEMKDGATAARIWEKMQSAVSPAMAVGTADAGGRRLIMRCAADIAPEAVSWLWHDRIPLGAITLFGGDPGLGKSTATVDFAARLSTGAPWPDGAPGITGDTLFLTAEDSIAQTVVPRLIAAGADMRRIQIIDCIKTGTKEKGVTLADVDVLRTALEQKPDARMVVIDPVSAYLDGEDSHNNSDIRALLTPLAKMASELGVAVVMVTHLSKGAGTRAVYRSMGSIAFVAQARASWLVVRDGDDENARLFVCQKNNLGPDRIAFRFRKLVDDRLEWDPHGIITSADEVLARENAAILEKMDVGPVGRPPKERSACAAWLGKILADGPQPVSALKNEAMGAGHSWHTVRNAADELSLDRNNGGVVGAPWVWSLPINGNTEKTPPASIIHGKTENSWQHGVKPHVSLDGNPRVARVATNSEVVRETSVTPPVALQDWGEI